MADKTLITRIITKHDSKTNWVTNNPVLLLGELGIEYDPSVETNSYKVRLKAGDGTSKWTDLPYAGGDEIILPAPDGTSIIASNNTWSIAGFSAAAANTYPVKNASGKIEWRTLPVDLTSRVTALENTIKDKANTADVYNKNQTYNKDEIDNMFSSRETGMDWKESVATFADIAKTYPNPEDGWTVNVKDTDYTYRYDGSQWIVISANAIPKATTSVDGLMTTEMVTKLGSIAEGANANVIESIATPTGDLTPSSKKVTIPTATSSAHGLVKGSSSANKVAVGTDGTMTVNNISTDKLNQGTNTLIFDCGTSVL